MAQLPRLGVHLRRGAHRSDLIEQALAAGVGDRVGLPGVLDDLTRQAMRAQVPGTQVEWGFRWADDDYASKQWWPQGITTSADADPIERVHGQRLILTSWYAQGSDGKNAGSRISVIAWPKTPAAAMIMNSMALVSMVSQRHCAMSRQVFASAFASRKVSAVRSR